ncbi:MAG: hypothetical protein LBU70_04720, partial [Chitinispirillales bacterium]|nr:hypothetical protein [Chitinispirillales bacterium]
MFFKNPFLKNVSPNPLTPLRNVWDNKGSYEWRGRCSFGRFFKKVLKNTLIQIAAIYIYMSLR